MKRKSGLVQSITKNWASFKYQNHLFWQTLKEETEYHSPAGIWELYKGTRWAKKFEDLYFLDPEKRTHIDLVDSPPEHLTKRGAAYNREIINGKSSLVLSSEQTIKDANIFAFGGLDFDTPMHLSALLKGVDEIAKYRDGGRKYKAVAIAPEVSKEARYNAAMELIDKPNYYPPYIQKRVEKYIVPRLITENIEINVELSRAKVIPITFFSYSLGGREVIMMENAIKDILKNWTEPYTDEEVQLVFGAFFRAVCVGYAIDPGHIKEMGFSKHILFGLQDEGVLRPPALQDLLDCPEVYDAKFHTYSFKPEKNLRESYLTTHGYGTIPNVVKGVKMPGHHSLPQYLAAFEKLPATLKKDIANNWCSYGNEYECIEFKEQDLIELSGEGNFN